MHPASTTRQLVVSTASYKLCMRRLFCLLFLFCATAQATLPVRVAPDDVRVFRQGEGVRVEVDMSAPVPPAIAWQVLTDFNDMPRFLTNLDNSRIVESAGNRMRVEQAGVAHYGLLSHRFQSVREIALDPPREVTARQISGTARRMDSRMRLIPTDFGTRLEYRAEIIPDIILPPLVGPAFIQHEIAEQFSAMIQEMVKRNAAPGRP